MNTQAVEVSTGAESIKQAYRESLSEKALDIICLSSNYDAVIGDFFEKEFSSIVYGKIRTREILPDTLGNRKSLAEKSRNINNVKFINPITSSESDMLIFADRVILISFAKDCPMTVVIREGELVKSFKSQFEALWGNLV